MESKADFLRRCPGALRDGDVREVSRACSAPHTLRECDPLLTLAVRKIVFVGASSVMCRTHKTAGDRLPCDEPAWCAQAIRTFADTLA